MTIVYVEPAQTGLGWILPPGDAATAGLQRKRAIGRCVKWVDMIEAVGRFF
jgi:hypothetical protein